jgi:Ca2+-binding RTX toxin-like protein
VPTITGTAGNDTLTGTSGNDTINGLGGNDLVLAGSTGGTDVVDGGAGSDSIDFSSRATSAVIVNFAAGTISGGSSGTISFTAVERVIAGNFNDSLSGSAAAQTLVGQGGSDTLWGAGGIDTLWGGGGADRFVFRETGSANADSVRDWTSGSDKLVLDGSVMSALGATGNFAASDARFKANSTGTATDSSDRVIYNTTTRQVFYDADGNGSGAAQLIATLQSGATFAATDVVVEGGGGGGGGQTINGTSGNDSLVGGPGNDTINGFAGEDTINGGAGVDSMVGGAHADTYFVDNTGDVIVEIDGGGFDTVNASVSYTLPAWVNNLTLTGTAAIDATGNELPNAITGNAAGNRLTGGEGNDTVKGGAGNDLIFMVEEFSGSSVNPGNDAIDGGDGIDGVRFAFGDVSSADAVVLDLAAGTYSVSGPSGSASGTLTSIEQAGGTFGNDELRGTDGPNLLLGGGFGSDTIFGFGGDDFIEGGSGSNLLSGAAGNDTMWDGLGADTIDGGDGNDVVHVTASDDTVNAGAGNDEIGLGFAFTGPNSYGNDLFDGGSGNDTLSFEEARGAIVVDLAAGTLTGGTGSGGTDSVSFTGIENFIVEFSDGTWADRISGSSAANMLTAAEGNDTLDGRAGNDSLEGGEGADQFFFGATPGAANADLIIDFASASDKIVLDGGAHANSGPSGNFSAGDARFWSSASGTAHDADDRVVYNASNGQLWYDADGNGAGAAQLIATIGGAQTLAATDIAIVNGSSGGGQVINGTSGNDSLVGGSGNDTINGFAGNDTLDGLAGNDSLDGGTGGDNLFGRLGGDTLVGGDGNDTLDGGGDNDVLNGGLGNDRYLVTHGDTISDTGGLDTVVYEYDTRDGTWTLGPGLENLVILGFFDGIPEEIPSARGIGNELDNVISNEAEFLSVGVVLDGGAGNDTLLGGGDADAFTFVAGSGNYGNDFVDGGGSDLDTLSFATAPSSVQVDLAAGTATGGGTGSVSVVNVEAIVGSAHDDRLVLGDAGWFISAGAGNDTLIGGTGDDFFRDNNRSLAPGASDDDSMSGGAGDDGFEVTQGDDWVDGGAGDDEFEIFGSFGYGADTIIGGDGIDTVRLDAETDAVVNLAAGTMTGGGVSAGSHAVLTGIENFVYEAAFLFPGTNTQGTKVRITGDAGDNLLEGSFGSDTLDGGAGNDTLTGHNQNLLGDEEQNSFLFSVTPVPTNADLIVDFLPGTDKIILDGTVHLDAGANGNFAAGDARFWSSTSGTAHDADDRVIYNTVTGQLWYDLDGSGVGTAALVATLEDTPAIVATDIAIINGRGQTINGTAGNDTLSGTAGNDTINGLGGNDLVLAGSSGGADVIDGGAGFDSIDFSSRATSAVVVDIDAGTITGGSSGTISFMGVERVVASNFNDSMTGDAGGQTLAGQAGADTLWGAAGVDTLWGGGGPDTFVFRETGGANADSIRDWASGADKVALDDSVMTALGATGNFVAGDARFKANSTGTATDANDRVIHNTSTGSLYYDADGSGAGAAQIIATFQGNPAVAATDITVI